MMGLVSAWLSVIIRHNETDTANSTSVSRKLPHVSRFRLVRSLTVMLLLEVYWWIWQWKRKHYIVPYQRSCGYECNICQLLLMWQQVHLVRCFAVGSCHHIRYIWFSAVYSCTSYSDTSIHWKALSRFAAAFVSDVYFYDSWYEMYTIHCIGRMKQSCWICGF